MASKRADWVSRVKNEIAEYRKLAKRANQRMVRLERYSDPSGSMYKAEAKGIKQFAYKIAQRNIKDIFGASATRFKENIKPSSAPDDAKKQYYQIMALKNAVNQFLGAASSTLAPAIGTEGIRSVQDKRTSTINERYIEKYGVEGFTADELGKFFASKKYDKLYQQYGSDYMFVIAATIKTVPTSKKDIRDFLQTHIDIDELTEQDLQDVDILDQEQALDIMENSNKIGELRKLMNFVDLVDSPILNQKITAALSEGYSAKNLFFKR